MKKLICLLAVIFLINFVSAYSQCESWTESCGEGCTQEIEWCCGDPGHVICDYWNEPPRVCGPSGDWCENWENPQLSCDIDSDWCCNDAGWVYDYASDMCCAPHSPYYTGSGCSTNFVSSANNNFYYDDGVWKIANWENTYPADNYFTRNTQCQIFHFNEADNVFQEECRGTNDLWRCDFTGTNFIFQWTQIGIGDGECGECSAGETACQDDFMVYILDPVLDNETEAPWYSFSCENYEWVNDRIVLGECGVECITNLDCPEFEEEKYCYEDNLYITTQSCIDFSCNTSGVLLQNCTNGCETYQTINESSARCIAPVGDCISGNTEDYLCADGTGVGWCICVSEEWDCIDNPESQCEGEFNLWGNIKSIIDRTLFSISGFEIKLWMLLAGGALLVLLLGKRR